MSVPFVLAPELRPGIPEAISGRITRVIAANPGPFTYTGSGTYLLTGDEETVVIDPGPDYEDHLQLVSEVAPKPIRRILITHTHHDHSGGTARLKELTGARSIGFGPHPHPPGKGAPALEEGGDFGFRPDETMADGECLHLPGLTITAVHTPGHISNHLCFALAEENALFSGDHIMGWATTVVAPPEGDMAAYFESLEKLLDRNDSVYYPTHGAPIHEPHAFVEAVRDHRLAREASILSSLKDASRTIPEIVDLVYGELSAPIRFAAGLNVTAHLAMHEATGRVRLIDGRYELVG